MANIMILGSGGFGISLAVMLEKSGHTVTMWSKFQSEIDEIRAYGEHKRLLPNIHINTNITLTSDLSQCNGNELVIFAVPSFAVRETAKACSQFIDKDAVIANVGKGFDEETSMRLSQVISQEIPNNDIVILSGPSHAEEIARGIPTTIVATCSNRVSAEFVQDTIMNERLRIYVNDDVIGVELGGALKNIIAVGAGMCDGLGLGDNSKAALITRGLAEIARLGKAMGASNETFIGLTGMGDLIVTCTSMHSRNRRCGILIGQGVEPNEAIKQIGMTVEGLSATKSAYRLSQEYNIEMPLTSMLYDIVENDKPVKTAISELMGRPKRHENEDIWLSSSN